MPSDQVITVEILPVSTINNVQNHKKQFDQVIENDNARQAQTTKPVRKKIQHSATVKKTADSIQTKQTKSTDIISPIKSTIKENKQRLSKNQAKQNQSIEHDELDSLLKNLEKSSDGNNNKSKARSSKVTSKNKQESTGIFDTEIPETINYSSLISNQLRENWNKPVGVIDKAFALKFNIRYNTDGSLIDYKLIDKNCAELDINTCTALIDSAQRAIAITNPIMYVDTARHHEWGEINYSFIP